MDEDYDYDRPRQGGGKRRGYRSGDEDDMDSNRKHGNSASNKPALQKLDSIEDPGKRFVLQDCIGSGVFGNVYEAIDEQAGNRKVAVKIQKLNSETKQLLLEEYRVLRTLSKHPNLPDFFGIFRKRSGKKNEHDEMWFAMECIPDNAMEQAGISKELLPTRSAVLCFNMMLSRELGKPFSISLDHRTNYTIVFKSESPE